jgi:hypothetical protein
MQPRLVARRAGLPWPIFGRPLAKPEMGERRRMTVCIAVLYAFVKTDDENSPPEHRGVITASDKMISAGDIKYEPPLAKLGFLGGNTIVMVSGDISAHSEAIISTRNAIKERQLDSVSAIAHAYADELRKITNRHAAQMHLAPLGLDHETFLSRQESISPYFVAELTSKLQEFRLEVEAIVTGYSASKTDAELYVIGPDCVATCSNDIGFAAIGEGAWHAKSHLMFARYSFTKSFAEAVFHTYAAKKRSEVAPHVGEATDMYIGLPTKFDPIIPNIRTALESVYDEQEKKKRAIDTVSVAKMLASYAENEERQIKQPSEEKATPRIAPE